MAKDAEAVIYIGGLNKNGFQDCEASDRREYNLPWGQDRIIEELAAVNPNLIVANVSGNAYAMPWLGQSARHSTELVSRHYDRAFDG